MEQLQSLVLERQVLASLLFFPNLFYEVENFHKDDDYSHVVHRACFAIIRDAASKKEKIDSTILAQRLLNIGLKKYEELDLFEYLNSLSFNKFGSAEVAKTGCEELSKLRKLRNLVSQTENTKKFILQNKDKSLDVIFSEVDKINNTIIQEYEFKDKPTNVFNGIKEFVEERADNPLKNFLMGPFPTINKIYGTLLAPACINLIGARSGVSKTALSMFYLLHVAEKYDLPILHLDFSEMTLEQLRFRAVSAFTNGIVPYQALYRGTWKRNPEWSKLVHKVWPRVEKLRMFYYDIGSMNEKQQISLMRRVYYKDVGRGNDLLLNYDYLKPFDSDSHHNPEWKQMGHFVQQYKSLVNNEIPQIRGWFSLQLNRSGITNNKTAAQIDDSENSFAISDRIIQQCTSAFLIRNKTYDELTNEGNMLGNLKALPLKFREILGDEWERHFKMVKMPDGKYKANYLNLNMKSFFFEDKGDLHDGVKILNNIHNMQEQTSENVTL